MESVSLSFIGKTASNLLFHSSEDSDGNVFTDNTAAETDGGFST